MVFANVIIHPDRISNASLRLCNAEGAADEASLVFQNAQRLSLQRDNYFHT